MHMTDAAGDEGESEADSQGGHESETELVPEDIAMEHHTAYVAYQTAKDKYKAAGEDHGHDPRHPLLPAWRTAGLRALEMEVPRPRWSLSSILLVRRRSPATLGTRPTAISPRGRGSRRR